MNDLCSANPFEEIKIFVVVEVTKLNFITATVWVCLIKYSVCVCVCVYLHVCLCM